MKAWQAAKRGITQEESSWFILKMSFATESIFVSVETAPLLDGMQRLSAAASDVMRSRISETHRWLRSPFTRRLSKWPVDPKKRLEP